MSRAFLVPLVLVPLLTAVPAASAESLRVVAGQGLVVDASGATAAYAVDESVVDVVLTINTVRVQGRRVGTTKMVVVIGDTLRTYDLEVVPAPRASALRATPVAVKSSVWSSFFNSETDRLTTSADSTSERAGRSIRVSASNVTRIGNVQTDVRSSMAAAFVDITSATRRITLLDQQVHATPLTLDGSRVRGLHYSDRSFDLHAGLSSPLLYRSVLIPAESDAVLGGTYTRRHGAVAISPSIYWYPTESNFGGARGAAAGLRVSRSAPDGRLRLAAEGGYGGEVSAAGNLGYTGTRHNVSVAAVHRPSDYPSLGAVRPYGTFVDGDWTARLSDTLRLHLGTNAARHELPASTQRTGTANAGIGWDRGSHWRFTLGSVVGLFDNGVSSLTSVSIPVGAGWESPHKGITGIFRYQQNTNRNRGGAGGRVRAHAGVGQFTASGFIDYQRDAATVDLVFRESPELARLFAELGVQVRTPDDLARLLREDDALVATGYLERVALILNPVRLQAGFDASWRSRGDGTQVRFNLLGDRVDATNRTRHHLVQSLSVTRRVARASDVVATATWWASAAAGRWAGHWSYSFGVRVRGNPLTDLTSWFRGNAVLGRVLRDDSAESPRGSVRAPMPGVRVRLDDGREAVTTADGRFRFADAGRGSRQVEVVLPASPGARFTAPSVVRVRPGEETIFTIGYVPARLIGFVRDDAAAPVRGVQIRAWCGGSEITALTNSEGRYTISHTDGECRVELNGASLPAGYDAAAVRPQTVQLARNAPAHADYTVRANRSLTGTIGTTVKAVTIRLMETGDERIPDDAGRFVFRNLKPGTFTVRADVGGQRLERRVIIPEGPAVVHVTLDVPEPR